MVFDVSKLQRFPKDPGVYIMRDRKDAVLYIGKAKNLQSRVRQYFGKHGDGRAMVPYLVKKVHTIDTIVVTSEKEALLLENTLIKEHQPPYNALLKDDKTYISLRINTHHKWPMLQIVRYKGRPKGRGQYFGPYTGAGAARQTFDLLNRMFPLRQCSDKEFAKRDRPCILYQMKRCAAPCVDLCTKGEYDEHVRRTTQFLQGQDREVLAELRGRMEKASESLEFERAGDILRTIRYIERTIEKQQVDRVNGTDADVLGIYREAEEVVVMLLVYRSGKLIGSQDFLFSGIAEEDDALLETFLLQNYMGADTLPAEILLPSRVSDAGAVEDIISESAKRRTKVTVPQKGRKKELLALAAANAKATFTTKKDASAIRERTLLDMQEKFRLDKPPRRMECFDTSHMSGEEPVASLVCFVDGEKESNAYRRYKVKEAMGGDDYGAMYEVMSRRFAKAKELNNLPDLLVVDGGKGHLNVALKVLKEHDIISVNVIGLAKEEGRHDKGMTSEQVFLPNLKDPILLRKNSPILFLLQRLRDEAHRFAITFHRKRRSKQRLTSELSQVDGVGPKKEQALLKHFGSVKELKKASKEAISSVAGVSASNAETIWNFFHK